MPNKTLSIPERDLPVWDRAQKKAARKRMTMSGFVLSVLEADEGDGTAGNLPPRIAQIEAQLAGDVLTDDELIEALIDAGLPELARAYARKARS